MQSFLNFNNFPQANPEINSSKPIPQDDKFIVTIPLGYTYFLKPSKTVFEALNKNLWRLKDAEGLGVDSTNRIQNQIPHLIPESSVILDNLSSLREAVEKANQRFASYGIITILNEFRITDCKLTVSIVGDYNAQQQIYDIRKMVMQAFDPVMQTIIYLDKPINRDFEKYLKQLSEYNGSSIYVTNPLADLIHFEIHVLGHRDQVKDSENKIRLKMDNLNPFIYCDYIELDNLSILPLIAGPKLANLKRIIGESQCTIYLPNLLPELYYEEGRASATRDEKSRIYITGIRALVLQAKHSISQILEKVSKCPFIKQMAVLPMKNEMLILRRSKLNIMNFPKDIKSKDDQNVINHTSTFKSSKIQDLMYDTGCYIGIPPLGCDQTTGNCDVLTFQGNSIEDVENAMSLFDELLSDLYIVKAEFTRSNFGPLNVNKFLNFCDTLASNSDCSVSGWKYGTKFVIQALGGPDSTRSATSYLSQFESYLGETIDRVTIHYQLELPNQEREFISGKKNGKLVKISNSASVSVQLLPFTDHNFIVELSGNSIQDSALGMNLLEKELPKSITFNIPESFHRQIIGVGGQTVQRIMRKFNVFIKFSNSFEAGDKPLDRQHSGQTANFGQGFVRKNNVIIKCPAKNMSQIPLAKLELEKLVDRVINDSYTFSVLSFTPAQWRLLTSANFNEIFTKGRKKPTNAITEIEKHTNTYIKFPGPDMKYNGEPVTVTIYGSDGNYRYAKNELKKYIPYCYRFTLTKSPKFIELVALESKICKSLADKKNLGKFALKFLENVVVPQRIMANTELDLSQDKDGDIIDILYYPTAFGYSQNSLRSERLNHEKQKKIVESDSFQQAIDALKKFLQDSKISIINEGIEENQLNVVEVKTHVRAEKENLTEQHANHGKHSRHSSNGTKNNSFHKHPLAERIQEFRPIIHDNYSTGSSNLSRNSRFQQSQLPQQTMNPLLHPVLHENSGSSFGSSNNEDSDPQKSSANHTYNGARYW